MKYYSMDGNSFSKLFERGFIMENLVEVKNNQVVTSSRQVAQSFNKQHRHIIRDIKNLLEGMSKIGHTPQMFFLTSYTNEQNGQTYPEYYMNRDGFSLLVMGFTGQKAIEWKIKYIQAFNQMEQALKERQSAAPAPVLKRVTYKGQIMMQSVDLAQLTGLSNATLLTQAKKHKLCHILLNDDTLKVFKLENHLRTGASRVVLYPRDTVVSLLMLRNLYSKFKNVILGYFKVSCPAPDTEKAISLQGDGIDQKIKKLEQEAATLDGLIQNLTSYRRTKEKHIEYIGVALEFAADLFTNIHRLRDKVTALEA